MALTEAGHEVYLGQMENTLSSKWKLPVDCYKEIFYLTSVVGLSYIAPYFDLIHVHEADWWTGIALAITKGSQTKVVHGCNKITVGSQTSNLNGLANSIVANTLSPLAVYASEVQQIIAETQVGEHQSNYIIVRNYPLRIHIPENKDLLPKVSKEDDSISLVYVGSLSEDRLSSRYLIDEFKDLLRVGYNVYCYSENLSPKYDQISRGYRNFYFMGHCKYANLIRELSQYNIGLIPFQKNAMNVSVVDGELSSQLFEYVSAGVPVACRAGLASHAKFITDYNLGFLYSTPEEFIPKAHIDNRKKYVFNRFKWTMEDEVKETLVPNYLAISPNYEYTKIGLKEMLTFKEYAIELEVFEGQGLEVGLYGRGHDMDLFFESYMAQERMIANETEKEEVESEVGGEGIAKRGDEENC